MTSHEPHIQAARESGFALHIGGGRMRKAPPLGRAAAGALGLMLGLVLMLLSAGCVSWASYPAQPGEYALRDPNRPPMDELMVAALKYAAERYPPPPAPGEAQFAVNLPAGMMQGIYWLVADRVGYGATPLSQESRGLPIYHVSSMRARGDEAEVTIFRPAFGLGQSPGGGVVYEEVLLRMRGGLQPWHVVSRRAWTLGTNQPPALNFIEDCPPGPPQYSDWAMKVRHVGAAETTPAPIVPTGEPLPSGPNAPPPANPDDSGQPR